MSSGRQWQESLLMVDKDSTMSCNYSAIGIREGALRPGTDLQRIAVNTISFTNLQKVEASFWSTFKF
jgi:hypothetical protein